MDTLVRGTSMDGAIRVLAAVTTDMANEAVRIHNTYPVATAALGRLLTGAALMGATLKNETDTLTMQVKGDGPLQTVVAVGDAQSRVRGYVGNPYVQRPLNDKGKLDVGGAVGEGFLTVIRDLGLKEPYIGQVPLVSGEIAEDISYYYSQSEQIPTAVGLGVLVDVDNRVLASGGFMIQMLPGSTDEMAKKLENILENLPPVTKLINDGITAEELFFTVTEGFDMLMDNNFVTPKYECKCSKE
ncbi:MAG: Hsp33 family molecular chaperone HslO, partial [Clostridia bacterium]|nr:Hsp33 family molecular chaperone HslO [Clostridia bacterium]